MWISVLCVSVMTSACNLSSGLDSEFGVVDASQDQPSDQPLDQRQATDQDQGSMLADDSMDVPLDGADASADGDADGAIDQGDASSDTSSVCGDGLISGGESCDDGNISSGDGCDDVCQTEPGYVCPSPGGPCALLCGDGALDLNEACDDGNSMAGDGCDAVCVPEAGYQCSGAPSVCTPVCGDGVITGSEQCDDGNLSSGDGCDALCAIEDGYVCLNPNQSCRQVNHIRSDPSMASTVPWPAGAPAGTMETNRCSDGRIMTGFFANDNFSQMSFVEMGCEYIDRVPNTTAFTPTGGVIGRVLGDLVEGRGFQGVGCINGWAAKGFEVYINAQDSVVGLGVLCSDLRVTQGEATFDPNLTWGPGTIGQTNAASSYSLTCPPGLALVGLSALFTTSNFPRKMARVGLICDVPSLEF